jgi:ABC-2 family transporter protein
MIWLTWRRHRFVFIFAIGVLIVLGVWMALSAHYFDGVSALQRTGRCYQPSGPVSSACFADPAQAQAIGLLLLALPCLVGLAIGAPLVAAELQNHTNRLAWTQGISRTKWFIAKWLLVIVGLLALMSLLQVAVGQWLAHVPDSIIIGLPFGQGLGTDHIQPFFFNITGVVPVCYTLFAFALGTMLGAVVRRTSWAIAATVIIYGAVSLTMVTVVRPNLMPQTFVPFPSQAEARLATGGPGSGQIPWDLGSGYRYAPDHVIPAGTPPANAAGQACVKLADELTSVSYNDCLSDHHLQYGEYYQPASHYWPLQWKEATIYLGASILLFGISLISVRRWRA